MKHMSIQQYGLQYLAAKTPWAKASLFVRSLGLRYALYRGKRRLEAQDAKNRSLRSASDAAGEQKL